MQSLKNERGQGLVEYVLLLVLMGVLAIGSLRFLGQKTHNAFSHAAKAVDKQTDYGDSVGMTKGDIND